MRETARKSFLIFLSTAKRKTLLSETLLRNIASTTFLNNQRVRYECLRPHQRPCFLCVDTGVTAFF